MWQTVTEFSTYRLVLCVCGGGRVGAWGEKKFVAVFPFRMDVTDAAANCPPIYVIFSSVLIEPVIFSWTCGCPK